MRLGDVLAVEEDGGPIRGCKVSQRRAPGEVIASAKNVDLEEATVVRHELLGHARHGHLSQAGLPKHQAHLHMRTYFGPQKGQSTRHGPLNCSITAGALMYYSSQKTPSPPTASNVIFDNKSLQHVTNFGIKSLTGNLGNGENNLKISQKGKETSWMNGSQALGKSWRRWRNITITISFA